MTGRSRGEGTPAGATFVAGDVSTVEGVKAIAAEAIGALGGLDILVNNAGGARPFAEGAASIPDEEWQASFDLNLFAAVRLTNAVLPALRESKVGAIVNISSNAAQMPFGPFAHYCAAKAALDMYSRALALDLGPKGIRVNVVSPGPVVTPGGDEARKAFSDATGAPARRIRAVGAARSPRVSGRRGGGRRAARVGSREVDDGREHPRRRGDDGAVTSLPERPARPAFGARDG